MRLAPKNTVLRKKCVRYFLLYEHVQIFWNRSMLTDKYCKTGVRERTLLRSRFIKVCMHVSCLMRTVLLLKNIDAACMLKL